MHNRYVVNPADVARYLGYQGTPDEGVSRLITHCINELEQTIHPRCHWQIFDGAVLRTMGFPATTPKAALIAATLGAEADILLHRYQKTDMTRATVLNTCANVLIGVVCDVAAEQIARAVRDEGLYLHPRTEPGCGEIPISVQGALLRLLSADKHIGVTANPSGVLLPSKSMTAFVPLAPTPSKCKGGCVLCGKTDCPYRIYSERNE